MPNLAAPIRTYAGSYRTSIFSIRQRSRRKKKEHLNGTIKDNSVVKWQYSIKMVQVTGDQVDPGMLLVADMHTYVVASASPV